MFDLKFAYEGGFISRLPSYNSIFNYFAMPVLRECLVQLVIASSVVLKSIEKCFAIDSTGFSTSRLGLWIDHRYGKSKATEKRKWLKVHLMCGVLTNIVTAVEVTDGNAGDSPHYKPLFETTDQNFKVEKVCRKGVVTSELAHLENSLRSAMQRRPDMFVFMKDDGKFGEWHLTEWIEASVDLPEEFAPAQRGPLSAVPPIPRAAEV